MKTLLWLLILCTLAALLSSCGSTRSCAQGSHFSVGMGAGASDKNAVIELSGNYNTPVIGVAASMVAHADNRNPAYFNGEIFKSFYSSERFKISPHIGGAYRLQSTDNKELNKFVMVFGLEAARHIGDRGIIYSNLAFSDNTIFLTVGLRGLLFNDKQ